MKLISTFILLCTLITSSFALSEEKILPVMEEKIDKVIVILQDKALDKKIKAEKIFVIMDELFDFKLMSRISLGKRWKTLSKEQQTQFSKMFEQRLKDSYLDKLDLYNDQKVEILKTEQFKKNRIKLLTQLVGSEEVYKVNYKFYKTKTGDWFIYDVDIIGVSIIQTYRKQFSTFLQSKSFDELLKTL